MFKRALPLVIAALMLFGLATPAHATLDSSGRAVPDTPSFYWDGCRAAIPGDLHATRPADTADLVYRERDAVADAPQWARDAWPGYTGTWWRVWAMPTGKIQFADVTPTGWDWDTFYDTTFGYVTTQTYYLPTRKPSC